MHTFITTLVALGACMTVLWPSAAAAQDPSPRLTVAAGSGLANPFYEGFDFNARNWELSGRGSVATHVAVEVFYEEWRHAKSLLQIDQAITGPSGFIGRVGRLEQRTDYRMRTLGFNALATGGSGRATFFGGGGVGLLAYDRRMRNTASGCDAATAHVCAVSGNESTFSSDSFTVQGVGEMDVLIVPRVQVYGRYMMVVPVRDVTFGLGTITGGVRVILW